MFKTLKDKGNALERVPPAPAWPPAWLPQVADAPSSECVKPDALPLSQPQTIAPMAFERAELSESVPTWEDESPTDPCPKCGTLELWQTLAGNWRCQHCDAAALHRSRMLAERAYQLRQLSKIRMVTR